MENFKTHFNPIIPTGRLIFALFFLILFLMMFYALFRDFQAMGFKEYLVVFLGIVFFGAFAEMFITPLLTTTKNYVIDDKVIKEFNFLTFKSKTIPKEMVKGFSTSKIPYRIWNFKQVIIYLKDGSKIDMMQFAYFNFKEIGPLLIEKEYDYLGHESYIWKWPNRRRYKYDGK